MFNFRTQFEKNYNPLLKPDASISNVEDIELSKGEVKDETDLVFLLNMEGTPNLRHFFSSFLSIRHAVFCCKLQRAHSQSGMYPLPVVVVNR